MRHFLLFLSMVMTFTAKGQTRSDLIYKTDNSNFAAVVDEIGDAEILYYLPADAAKRTLLHISRKQVWKIIYSNGEIEMITEPSAASPAVSVAAASEADRIFLKNKTMLTGWVTKVSGQKIEYRKDDSGPVYELLRKDLAKIEYGNGNVEEFDGKVTRASTPEKSEPVKKEEELEKKKDRLSGKFSVTAGPEAGYYLGTKAWTDEQDGLGFLTSLGGSLRFNYKLNKPVSIYFTTGYNGASVEKNYLEGDVEAYKETYSLDGAHAGIGVKYFLKESIYILGEGRANFLKVKVTYSGDGEEDKYDVSAMCPSFSAGIGFTKKVSRIVVEADIHYRFTQSAFDDLTDPIHSVGARLAVGLADIFKK
ncbi:outer membrane protein [Dyadobacter psychrotolerans]|uniref:Outer membrane protein beta-barrel domain-containing protein n=1 Tax=Dyadobacter psychrotolerans TaxID=2541721 RepID=A0A4R5E043_9BACT|nr:hypothetical protein [Dyadobacter psychrotolerans]TDE17095.1 hypothetical protein E0F88_04120 [Dyadobacter psychrotolerans]